jgi:hypothetical protein
MSKKQTALSETHFQSNAPASVVRQVRITWQERSAEPDEELAPVLLALWQLGIDADDIYQEARPNYETVWLEFASSAAATQFLNLVAEFPDDDDEPYWETLYARVGGSNAAGQWLYMVKPV